MNICQVRKRVIHNRLKKFLDGHRSNPERSSVWFDKKDQVFLLRKKNQVFWLRRSSILNRKEGQAFWIRKNKYSGCLEIKKRKVAVLFAVT